MSPEAQRIAIAEACGWKQVTRENKPEEIWEHQKHPLKICRERSKLPDYLNDLNVMHEAEKVLSDNNQMKFRGELIDMMIPKYGFESACLLAIHATAAQRAEAFLRTIGKWEETRK